MKDCTYSLHREKIRGMVQQQGVERGWDKAATGGAGCKRTLNLMKYHTPAATKKIHEIEQQQGTGGERAVAEHGGGRAAKVAKRQPR